MMNRVYCKLSNFRYIIHLECSPVISYSNVLTNANGLVILYMYNYIHGMCTRHFAFFSILYVHVRIYVQKRKIGKEKKKIDNRFLTKNSKRSLSIVYFVISSFFNLEILRN